MHAKLLTLHAIFKAHVSNSLLSLYAECGDIQYARQLFDQMPHKNVVSWTSLISGYVHHGHLVAALHLFDEMMKSGPRPNQYTLAVSVRACTNLRFQGLGLQIHGLMICLGLESDEIAGSSLVDMYFKLGGDIGDAYRVFVGLISRDSVTWNVMISGFSKIGYIREALKLVWEMQAVDGLKPNDFTLSSLLKCCGNVREVEQVHGMALKYGTEIDVVVGNAIADSYGKCGNIRLSRKVFDSMPWKDCFLWSSIISGYAKQGNGEESIILYRDMCRQGLHPDQHALSSALKACCKIGDREIGIQAHAHMIKNGYQSDCFVASVLLTIYTNLGEIREMEKIFKKIRDKDLVAWNSMILGYAHMEGSASLCFKLFRELCQTTILKPDGATLVAVLQSCHDVWDLMTGIQIHGMIKKISLGRETQVANVVIQMYSVCGTINDAYKAFIDVVCKDDISWSSIIGSYQKKGFELEALRLCKEMLANGIHLTNFSLPSCIAACAGLAAINVGKQFHSFVVKYGLNTNVYVVSSIIDMYAKCGNLEESKYAFDELQEPNEATINALISGFGLHGKALEAIEVFKEMEEKSLVPNQITFLAILSACSHVGLVEESLFFFDLMQRKYNINPDSEHYSCMIDIFGRSGRLVEALKILQNDGGVLAWRTLLSASRNHGDIAIARKSAQKVIEFDPSDHAAYVLLSDLYSREGKWEEALELREKMRDAGLKKNPGNSWLIFRDSVEEFSVGGHLHHENQKILKEANVLNSHSKNVGSGSI